MAKRGRKPKVPITPELIWWINHLYYMSDLGPGKIAEQVRVSSTLVSRLLVSREQFGLLDKVQDVRLKRKEAEEAEKRANDGSTDRTLRSNQA